MNASLQVRIAAVLLGTVVGVIVGGAEAHAQGVAWQETGQRIEAVKVRIAGLESDAKAEALLTDRIRRTLALYPTGRFDRFFADANLAKIRRLADVEEASYSVAVGAGGGVVIDVSVKAQAGLAARAATASGLLAPGATGGFPVLYERDGTFLKLGVTGALNFNFNENAWYGRPATLLDGNPLVNGAPGRGSFAERSSFVELGVYGITPVTDALYVYGGASYLVSGSIGQDLFENRDRVYGAIEDAYVGFVGGTTQDNGERIVWNVSGGRKKFSIGDGFLIGATSANGSDRAMINYSPRWAADRLLLAEMRWNVARVQLFSIEPDELPVLDTGTRVDGANLESQWSPRLLVAATHLRVPESKQKYFLADFSQRSREGLRVYGARFDWLPSPGRPGPVLRGEYAEQRNANFPMRAVGAWLQGGWSFADVRWTPRITYRYATLSGDDPSTRRYERWDPLLMGTSPWDWVQGMNHGKVFGNANRISHRLQFEFRPRPDMQLISQYWEFRADRYTNVGGLSALTTLSSKDLGSELNVMGRWFFRKNAFWQAQVAFTQPGEALQSALGTVEKPWVFFNTFVRVSY